MFRGQNLATIKLGIVLLGLGTGMALPAGAQPSPRVSPSPVTPSVRPLVKPNPTPSRLGNPTPPGLVNPTPTPTPIPTPTPEPVEWVRPQEVRALPGYLDKVPVFNSNSPEVVLEPGILLSTFPPGGQDHPRAHLNFAFNGRFDIFAHHIGRFQTRQETRSVYLGLLVQNPPQAKKPVTLNFVNGASYRTQPEAPFVPLPSWVEDSFGAVYAGPGSRVTSSILRRRLPSQLPPPVTVQPGEYQLLSVEPIVVNEPDETTINGRSLLLQLESDGPVYLASLAYFGQPRPVPTPTPTPSPSPSPLPSGKIATPKPTPEISLPPEQPPTLEDWIQLLKTGDLIEPRDRVPTPIPIEPGQGQVIYGRVAGVTIGSEWVGLVADPDQSILAAPAPGQAISYPISSLYRGTLGTGQIQSATLAVRYPDTAYQSHGNYGVTYRLVVPLKNTSDRPRTVTISLETPLKEDMLSQKGLRFFVNPPDRIFYRGTVRVRYRDAAQRLISRYIHLVMRRGQQGEPLATLDLAPGEEERVNVDLIYPADSTPPQVLTIETLPRQAPPQALQELFEEEPNEQPNESPNESPDEQVDAPLDTNDR